MKKATKLLSILLYSIFSIFMVGGIVFYFIYTTTSNHPNTIPHYCTELTDWFWVHEDGTREAISLPISLEADYGVPVTIETTLPDNIDASTWLCILNRRDMRITVDGEVRIDYLSKSADIPGFAVKDIYMLSHLSEADRGKTLTISRTNPHSINGKFSSIYIGDSYGIFHDLVYDHAHIFITLIVLMICSTLLILGGIIVMIIQKKTSPLVPLSEGVFLGCTWYLCNSMQYQLIFDIYYIDGTLAYISMMLMPFPFLRSMNLFQKKRYNIYYTVLEIATLGSFVFFCLRHFMDISRFPSAMENIDLVLAVIIVLMICVLIYDIIRKRNKEYLIMSYGILFAGVLCVIEVIRISKFNPSNQGILIIVALWIIFLSAILQQLRNTQLREKERILAISSNEAKSTFLAKCSHELRTPINAVIGFDEMILRESNQPEVRQYAMDIKNSATSLLTMVNDILDSSKIESHKIEIVAVDYSLRELILSVNSMMKLKASAKNLNLCYEIDEKLPSVLHGDVVRIKQVLVNLLTNSIKYTENGMVILSITGQPTDSDYVLNFSVRDTGMGIKEEHLATLFDAYARVESDQTHSIEGTGLGLNICKNLVALMGGTLKAESTYGVGSNFYFDLVQQVVDYTNIGNIILNEPVADATVSNASTLYAPKANILIVDDNEINRKVFIGLLKTTGMNIVEANSGESCLKLAGIKKFDIIFLDHMMPEMDGIETLHRLNRLPNSLCKDTPIIMFTANASIDSEDYYHKEGAQGYLAKPVLPEKLEEMLKSYLPAEYIKEMPATTTNDKKILPTIDEFDWKSALQILRNEDMLLRTLADYYEMLMELPDKLNQYDAIADYKNYRIAVHSLKSSSTMVGANLLSNLARLCEVAAKENNVSRLSALHPILVEEINKHAERLRTIQ